jgi:hypothetical protein
MPSEGSINAEVYPKPIVTPIEGIATLQLGPVQHSPMTFYQEQSPINNQLIITDDPIQDINHLFPAGFLQEIDDSNTLLFRERPLMQEQIIWKKTIYEQTGPTN